MSSYKNVIFIVALLFIHLSVDAQRTVTGVVADTEGEPLVGANILAQGTYSGTRTDIDGSFELSVPDGANVLIIAFTGYESQEFDITGHSNISVVLEEAELFICDVSYPQHKAIFINSGVRHTPFGISYESGFCGIFYPLYFSLDVTAQSNLSDNNLLQLRVNVDPGFWATSFPWNVNFQTSVRSITYNGNFDSKMFDFSTVLKFKEIEPIIGVAWTSMSQPELSMNAAGIAFGFQKKLYTPLHLDLKAMTRRYKNLNEYDFSIESKIKRTLVKVKYNQVGVFKEITIGLGRYLY